MTSALGELFNTVRARTEQLCAPVSAEDAQVQSMANASPTKWHLAHTSWFFDEFVLAEVGRSTLADPQLRFLYNSYYESVGQRHCRAARGLITRPNLAQVLRWRAEVTAAVSSLLSTDAAAPLLARIRLGIEHEQQHQELILTDLLHAMAQNPTGPAIYPKRYTASSAPAQALQYIAYPGGLIEIGADASLPFAYDCEHPRHRRYLAPFALATRAVCNAEYREFIDDGGYRQPGLWLSAGWARVQNERWRAPPYWSQALDAQYTLSGWVELEPAAPVCHLSYFEADAFARWAGARLPREDEWEHAAQSLPTNEGHYADADVYTPRPAPAGAGLRQVYGDVWEWTASSFEPYPGFAPASGAIGEYNGKFMCGQYVLRGGSCATPRGHLRASYRNFFAPEDRWQYSGLRLARDLE